MNFIQKTLFWGGFVSNVVSLSITLIDKDFKIRWISFFLWCASVIFFLVLFLPLKEFGSSIKSFIKTKEANIFFLIVVFSIFVSFLFLSIYPFNSIGDELRDGGWDAMRIANGEIKNIFYYGRYEAHGLLIPTLNVPFYKLFGNSTLVFKVPAAILSVLDISLVFYLCRKFISHKTAYLAPIVLLSLPLHLYYSRSEVVVIWSSFLTIVTILLLFNYINNDSDRNLCVLALIIGVGLNFHASVRTVLFLIISITIYCIFKSNKQKLRKKLYSFSLFVLFVLLSFGPRMLFTPPQILFHTSRISALNAIDLNDRKPSVFPKEIFINYSKSLLVYISEPTTSHYSDHKPILTYVLAFFFLIGIIGALVSKNKYLKILLIFALVIPFTNSAITDIVNGDHRLAPLLPISSIFVGFGAVTLYEICKNLKIKKEKIVFMLIAMVIVSVCLANIINFFYREPASYGMFRYDSVYIDPNDPELAGYDKADIYQDFMLTNAISLIKNNENLRATESLCIVTTEKNFFYFDLPHASEQFYYFLPGITILPEISIRPISDDELYISKSCSKKLDGEYEKFEFCKNYSKFICPPDKKSFTIYTEKLS